MERKLLPPQTRRQINKTAHRLAQTAELVFRERLTRVHHEGAQQQPDMFAPVSESELLSMVMTESELLSMAMSEAELLEHWR